MNIEVIEFYPMERDEEKEILTGTLRIKLPDIGIHILGIWCSKKKESWIFSLPGRTGINETGEKVRYPCFVFEDREKQKDLITAIRKNGRDFIEKRLADIENPLIFPEKKEKESRWPVTSTTSNNAPEAKETASISKPEFRQTIALKKWMDPPARKAPPVKRFNRGKV